MGALWQYFASNRQQIQGWAVTTIWLAAVPSVIGTSQLGQLFIAGSNLGTLTPIVLGLICFVILALGFDLLILLAVRTLAPWRRAVAA